MAATATEASSGAGALIRRARKVLDLTQREVAEAVGVEDSRTIGEWERGTVPQKRFREPLARTLRLDLQSLHGHWGVALDGTSGASVHHLPVSDQRDADVGPDSEEVKRFREALLRGMEEGWSQSRWWVLSTSATAVALGIAWEPRDWVDSDE